jgi:hypothetical protein
MNSLYFQNFCQRQKSSHRLEQIHTTIILTIILRAVSPVIFESSNNSMKMSFLFFVDMRAPHFQGISCIWIIHFQGTLNLPNTGKEVIKFTLC